MRASVWASTALVGSTSTRISASASSARAKTTRWRWPPENERPRSSTLPSSPCGSDSSTSSAFATATRLEDGRIVRAVPGVELVPERAGEEQRVGLADHDPSPDELDRQLGERHPAEADALALDEPAQPVGERDRVLRPVRDEGGEHARRDDEPGAGVRQQRLRGRSGGRRGGIGDQRLDRKDVEHPSRADEGPRHLVDGLGGRAEREHEEGGIAVERNELARGDSPVDRETSADPDDGHDEDPGQEHLRGVERRLRQGHPHSREPHLLRAASVAIEEDRLAADSRGAPGGRRPYPRRER